MFLLICLVLGIVLIAVMALRELFLYGQGRSDCTRRRLTLRMSMAAMLLFLLASILIGVYVFHLGSPEDSGYVQLWAFFWGCIMLIVVGVFFLVLADLRMISSESQQDTNELWRDIAQTIADHEVQRHKDR